MVHIEEMRKVRCKEVKHDLFDGYGTVSRTSCSGPTLTTYFLPNLQSLELSVAVPTAQLVVSRTPVEKYALESEGIPSRVISVYDKSQSTVSRFLNVGFFAADYTSEQCRI